jgi:hypothetical protein
LPRATGARRVRNPGRDVRITCREGVIFSFTGQYHVLTSAALSSGASNVVLWQATNSKILEIYTAGVGLTH